MVKIESGSDGQTNGCVDETDEKNSSLDLVQEELLRAREKEVDMDLVDELRALIKAEFESNSDKYAPNHYEEIMNPKSSFTCWRYITHKDNKINEAFELIKASLIWRKENCFDDLDRSELIKEFWHFTPIPMSGRTREGNEIMYVLGKHYRKPHAKLKPFIPKFCGNNLFGWDRKHDLDLMKLHIIFDVSETGYRNIDLDFMTWLVTAKEFMPARFHQFSVVGIPFIIRPLVHLILSWLPDSYRQITYLGSFDRLVKDVIDDDNLPVEVGGTRDEGYKLAPLDAPWASESAIFNSDEMFKYVEDCIPVEDTKRAQMREYQLEYEKSLKSKQQQQQQQQQG